MTALDQLLYPELRRIAPEARPAALGRARRQPLDWMELAGLGLAVVLVTFLTGRWHAAQGGGTPLVTVLVNFLLALPLLAVSAGPVLWHRTRRALRSELTGIGAPRDPTA